MNRLNSVRARTESLREAVSFISSNETGISQMKQYQELNRKDNHKGLFITQLGKVSAIEDCVGNLQINNTRKFLSQSLTR